MKYLFSTGVLFLFIQFSYIEDVNNASDYSKAPGITFFKGTLDEAKELAKKEKKFIFIDAYTTWCGPCKMMSKNTFTDEKVGEFFNEYYINLKIDMERGIGPKVAVKYGVTAYPTLLIIDESGNLMSKTVGYQNPSQLLSFGYNYSK